jgi:hypothetical protein
MSFVLFNILLNYKFKESDVFSVIGVVLSVRERERERGRGGGEERRGREHIHTAFLLVEGSRGDCLFQLFNVLSETLIAALTYWVVSCVCLLLSV